jgi:antitoxin (DNA-binding transcriptional repressor) of toxin-antitoxin stability system
MIHMRTATVRQLRTEFPRVLAWVNAGEEIAITRRHKIVATLSPAGAEPKSKPVLPDFRARRRRILGDRIVPPAVMAEILEDNKGHF